MRGGFETAEIEPGHPAFRAVLRPVHVGIAQCGGAVAAAGKIPQIRLTIGSHEIRIAETV